MKTQTIDPTDCIVLFADLLADVVLEQPPDEEGRGEDGDPQGGTARGHQGDHGAVPAPSYPSPASTSS